MTSSDSALRPQLPVSQVPARALGLSLAALLVPFAASGLIPSIQAEDLGFLIWIAALIPAFLLSYYRGWRGSAVALAAGMAILALGYDAVYLLGWIEPRPAVVLAVVTGYIAFSIGLGVVTELLHRARRDAEAEALTDSLTELANRRYMEVYLQGAVHSAKIAKTPLSLVVFDLDHFKWLNDTHGHAAGDEVLKEFAGLLRRHGREGWLFARSGGEEFVGVMPNIDWEAAVLVAEAIRDDLEASDLRWKPVTVSAGVASLAPDMDGWPELLEEADGAVYRAKELGRDRVEVGNGRGSGSGVTVENPHLGEDQWVSSRGIVVLPKLSERRSIRRALELNGLLVDEWGEPGQVPIDFGSAGPVAVVVSAADSVDQVSDVARAMGRLIEPSVPKVFFVPDHVVGAFRAAPEPRVVLAPAPPTGEKLLTALPRALATTVVRGDDPQLSAFNRTRSALGVSEAPLTEGLILVVDDERSNRLALQRTLDEIGFRNVVALSSAKEALELLRRSSTDLLVLDLHLPDMDGFALMEALEPEMRAGTCPSILVVTGDHKWETRQRALRMGARDFLNKPFDVAELGARVLNLLESRQMHLQMKDTNRLLESRVRQRTWELRRAKDEILTRLARAAEYRDDVTGRHAERVGEAARMIAEAAGMSKDECDVLRKAAPLHDIGKIGIPDAILLKPAPLTASEFDTMKQHTRIGAALLEGSTSEVIQAARVVALTHHERWDGSGYPDGLAGRSIPTTGRIVALADALDALTHERPYKPVVQFEIARERLDADSGSAFDPRFVAAMNQCADQLTELMASDD